MGKEHQELESGETGQLQSSFSILPSSHRTSVFSSVLRSGHLLAQMDVFVCGSESRIQFFVCKGYIALGNKSRIFLSLVVHKWLPPSLRCLGCRREGRGEDCRAGTYPMKQWRGSALCTPHGDPSDTRPSCSVSLLRAQHLGFHPLLAACKQSLTGSVISEGLLGYLWLNFILNILKSRRTFRSYIQ